MKNQSKDLVKLTIRNLCLVVLVVTFSSKSIAAEEVEVLTQAQWNVPRSGTTIVNMPSLQKIIRKYQSATGNSIQIKHAGGDEGTLWAYELRGWLISLGIPSKHIELLPGASSPEQLELKVLQQALTAVQVNPNDQPDKLHTLKHE